MTLTLLAAKAAIVLATALGSGQVPHPDAHAATVAATNRPPAHVVVAPRRKATDGALD